MSLAERFREQYSLPFDGEYYPAMKTLQRKIPIVLAFLAGSFSALTLSLVYITFIAPARSFPKLDDGSYLGELSWVSDGASTLPRSFFLSKEGERFSLLLPSGDLREKEQVAVLGTFVNSTERGDAYAPVQFQVQRGQFLLFSAGASSPGTIVELESGETGSWEVQPLPRGIVVNPSESSAEAVVRESESGGGVELLHLALLAEEQSVSEQLERYQIEMQRLAKRVEGLEEQLTDEDHIRRRAHESVQAIETRLAELRDEKREKQAALQRLGKQLELARSSTKFGELLRLSKQAQHLDEALGSHDDGGLFQLALPFEGPSEAPSEGEEVEGEEDGIR
ncbi:hypothetical protein MRY87_00895 [bacterium]|nr:hypothetical protein [bacterium]